MSELVRQLNEMAAERLDFIRARGLEADFIAWREARKAVKASLTPRDK
jgi:hypothetical protein